VISAKKVLGKGTSMMRGKVVLSIPVLCMIGTMFLMCEHQSAPTVQPVVQTETASVEKTEAKGIVASVKGYLYACYKTLQRWGLSVRKRILNFRISALRSIISYSEKQKEQSGQGENSEKPLSFTERLTGYGRSIKGFVYRGVMWFWASICNFAYQTLNVIARASEFVRSKVIAVFRFVIDTIISIGRRVQALFYTITGKKLIVEKTTALAPADVEYGGASVASPEEAALAQADAELGPENAGMLDRISLWGKRTWLTVKGWGHSLKTFFSSYWRRAEDLVYS